MVKTKPKTADEIFSKVDEDKKAIAESLRIFIKMAVPKATEIVRRGKITFALDGKDFAGIRLTKQHVDLLLMHGSSISSPLLKGQGTIGDPKHIEVNSFKNFDEAEVKRLLREAASLA
jgi:hypothetical protein